jgi:AcrR family transcriptional regulator
LHSVAAIVYEHRSVGGVHASKPRSCRERRSSIEETMKTAERRQNLKETLIALAERAIDRHGLPGIRARELAAEAGCSVGAIYNLFADLDDLILAVNERTLGLIEDELAGIGASPPLGQQEGAAQAIAQMVRLALGYLHFAATHQQRWRALFDHRLAAGKHLPDWYVDRRQRMFAIVEQPLRVLRPGLEPERAVLIARSLFSAVHGVVLLGLEEKIGDISAPELAEQLTMIVSALGQGLGDAAPERST